MSTLHSRLSLRRERWLLAVLVASVVAILASTMGGILLAGMQVELAHDAQPYSQQVVGEILPGQTIGQTFVAPSDGLYRIDVKLATYARVNECRLVFRLFDMRSGELVVIDTAAADIQDNAYRSFAFPEIGNSQGRIFLFSLESPDAAPGRAVTAYASNRDAYAEGALYRNYQQQPHDLAFKTYYRPSFTKAIAGLLDRVTANKPGVFGNKATYLILAAAHILCFTALFAAAMRFGREEAG